MHSIKSRLIFYSMILIIFPVLITVSITNIKSNEIILGKIDESIYNNINQVKVNIDDILENSRGALNVFILNRDIKKLLYNYVDPDSPEGFTEIQGVMNLLSNMVKSSVGIDSIYIYDVNDDIVITSSKSALKNSGFNYSYIYTEAVNKGRMGEWIACHSSLGNYSSNDHLVTYAMPVKIYEENMVVGYVFINVNEKTLYKYLERVKFNGQGEMIVTNGAGEILSNKDKTHLGKAKLQELDFPEILSADKHSFPFKINNGNTLVFKEDSLDSGLNYIALVPISNINREISTLQNIIVGVCILTVGFAALLSIFFVKSIYVPINRLVIAMGKLAFRSDFDYFINEKRKDEFGKLYDSFNSMVKGMKQLFEQLLQERLKKKEAQLKFLQAQINPHFLYNTLNSIYCISKLHGIKEITELSYSLTNYFRISLSGGLELITVREMLDQINFYLRIQNIRYKDQLEITSDIDEELLDYPILKFLLQPLVENSILHGMKNKQGRGLIEITGYILNHTVKFTVRDNGFGIAPEELDKIQSALSEMSDDVESGNMFALRSIHRRIRLHYGEEYGLRIFSIEGEGTVAEVVLPYLSKEGDKNVQIDDR